MQHCSLASLALLLCAAGTVLSKPVFKERTGDSDGSDIFDPILSIWRQGSTAKVRTATLAEQATVDDVLKNAIIERTDNKVGNTGKTSSDSGHHGGSFAVELVRNGAYRQNGPAELAWAYAKYGKDMAAINTDNRASNGSVGAFNQSYDREYLSPMYIGTPGQLCWLDIDTGSGDL